MLLSNISFQVSIGIPFITLIFWRFLKFNKDEKERKENLKKFKKEETVEKKDKLLLIFLIFGILISVVLGIIFYKYNPIKPLVNLRGINYLTNYTYDIFVTKKPYLHTFISIFPFGLFIGIYYIFKEENKHFSFFSLTTLVSTLELIVLLFNVDLKILPNYIFSVGFNLLQIFMIIYIFSNLEEKFFNLIKSAYITLAGLVIIALMPRVNVNRMLLEASYMIFVLEAYILLNYSDKRFWRLASWMYTLVCVSECIGYLIVNFL